MSARRVAGSRRVAFALLTLLVACAPEAQRAPPRAGPPAPAEVCGGAPMTVRFYDVGQALAVLVELPDGRRVLVDTGEDPKRAGCGAACSAWSEHLLSRLAVDAPGGRIDALWITHQHSDHLGNAAAIIQRFDVGLVVDNGSLADARLVRATHEAAASRGVAVVVVDPASASCPLASTREVAIRAVVPKRWPARCDSRNQNDCSVGLRIDYCRSSVLFTGDAGAREEAAIDPGGPVTLLQVGHHGSETSSSRAFLDRVRPKWAVISAAAKGEGQNRTYCHPRGATVAALSRALGETGGASVSAFDGAEKCTSGEGWSEQAASPRLFVTARDGDVVLTTRGDGHFERAR